MRRFLISSVLSGFLLSIVATQPSLAQEDRGENVEMYGVFLGNITCRTTGQRPRGKEGGDFLLAEERVRLDITAWSSSGNASAQLRGDFFHDVVAGEFGIDLRETYVDHSTDDFDFRLGRQIVTWGVGDLVFINDVFPKDWMSFFSGRPLEYLKIGVDGLRTRYSSNVINAELLLIPVFTPDIIPTPARFFLFEPFATAQLGDEIRPKKTYRNTEVALRLYRSVGGFDMAAYAYKGFWRTPSMEPDSFVSPTRVTAFYPELSACGISTAGSVLDGILRLESGYYHSRNDNDGDQPSIPNSQVRVLVGYERQLREDFTAGIQYYAEVMEDYSAYRKSLPAIIPEQKQYLDTITLRLEQLLKHQTWRLLVFAFYSPAASDYLIQPKASYKFSDYLSGVVGANIFGGKNDTTFLGQFHNNDNVYLSVRFDY